MLDAKITATEFYVTDHLGSVIGRFDHNGAWKGGTSYDPYGQARFESGTKIALWTFTGQWQQTPTMYKLGARYYDTTTGRCTQMDPTGQEANPYTYAGGNPCNNTDPTGAITNDQALCGFGMLATIGEAGALLIGAASAPFTLGAGAALAFGSLAYMGTSGATVVSCYG